jgi:preprotein translocase subunit SecD
MNFRVQSHAVLVLLLLSGCASRPRALSVHVADYSDTPQQSRIRVEMPSGEAPLYADPTSVLDERDFKSASFARDEFGQPLLRLCFASAGRPKFLHVAEQNTHKRLVFLVHGKVLFAPVIDSAAAPECLEISGVVTADQAATLQSAIH